MLRKGAGRHGLAADRLKAAAMFSPIRTLDARLDTCRRPINGVETNRSIRALDWLLRGVGQVVFQNNWLSGALILVGIGLNSLVFLVAAVVGTAFSTATAVVLRADRGMIDAGLFGFNGCLVGLGLVVNLTVAKHGGSWPSAHLWTYVIVCAAFSTVILVALGSLLGSRMVPVLTAPFVFATWIFLFAVFSFSHLGATSQFSPGLPNVLTGTSDYTLATLTNGTMKGVAEVFFQDSRLTGLLVVVGVLVNTRIGALMCLSGSALAALVAMGLGADEATINLGMYGFNASLTAIALGGVFFVLNGAGVLYTAFGVAVTVVALPTIGTLLAPIGMPTLTFPFVLVTWIFVIAKVGIAAVTPVAPADTTYPEDNYRRWRVSAR